MKVSFVAYSFSDDELNTLIILRIVGAILSIVSALFIILLYSCLCSKTRCRRKKKMDDLIEEIQNQEVELNQSINCDKNESYDELSEQNPIEEALNRTNTFNRKSKKKVYRIGIGNDLLFGYSISVIVNSIAFLVKTSYTESEKNGDNDTGCLVQAFLKNFGSISMYAYIACIAHAFLVSISISSFKQINRLVIGYLTVCILLPLVFAIVPLLTDSYGFAVSYCMYEYNEDNIATRVLLIVSLIYNLISCVFQIICTVITHQHFSKRYKEIVDDKTRINEVKFIKQYRVLIWIVTVLLILYQIPNLLNLFTDVFLADYFEYLSFFQNLSIAYCGFFLNIVFIFYFRQIFHLVFPKCMLSKSNANLPFDDKNDKKKEIKDKSSKITVIRTYDSAHNLPSTTIGTLRAST